MCDTPPDDEAVHCPACEAEPGKPCRSPSGEIRRVFHSTRMHLAYAIVFPEANFYRAEAERYRLRYPDVEARQVWCSPSAAQVRWWARWGRSLHYDRKAYEAEHGPDESIKALPPGETVESLMEKIHQAQEQEKARRKP
jgi:hypothetical protein